MSIYHMNHYAKGDTILTVYKPVTGEDQHANAPVSAANRPTLRIRTMGTVTLRIEEGTSLQMKDNFVTRGEIVPTSWSTVATITANSITDHPYDLAAPANRGEQIRIVVVDKDPADRVMINVI